MFDLTKVILGVAWFICLKTRVGKKKKKRKSLLLGLQ